MAVEIVTKSFPNLIKDTEPQIQEAAGTTIEVNIKKTHSNPVTVKLLKTKYTHEVLEAPMTGASVERQ